MRKLATAIATIGLGAGLIAASPAATAAPTAGDVAIKAAGITLYEHPNFGGKKRTFTSSDLNLANNTWENSTVNMDNAASSQVNARNASVWLWEHASKAGAVYRVAPNSADAHLGSLDDAVSGVEL